MRLRRRRLRERTILMDRPRERLLAVDVLVGVEGGHRHRGVHVVRRGHRDAVDAVVQGRHHLAEVGVGLRGRVLLRGPPEVVRVGVAQTDHDDRRMRGDLPHVHLAHAADPDGRDLELLEDAASPEGGLPAGEHDTRRRGRSNEGAATHRVQRT